MRKISRNGETVTLMTIREVAGTGLLSEYALRLMQRSGTLPGIAVGSRYLVNYEALQDLLLCRKK